MESILAGLASNAMSEMHAEKQYERERKLMDAQNAMNKANALDAYRTQIEGMRMAGLNPASAGGSTPISPTVSKGSVGMAENVEFDPTTMLLEAQAENLKAQTEKTEAETDKITGVDTKNTEADTNLKAVQKLLGEANTDKVNAETTNLNNLNKAFAEENSAMGLFGQTMAQNWQKEPWYNKLSNGSKMVIDDIAKGELDLTVGIANALNKAINTDQNMNETEKNKFEYELTEKVISAQMKNPKVMKALEKFPSAQYNELINRATKLATETKLLNFDYNWNKEKKNVWEKNDPDKLYADYQKNPTVENAAKWLVSSMRNTGTEVLKGTAPAILHGSALQKGMTGSKTNQSKGDWMDNVDTKNWSDKATRDRPNYGKSYQQMKNEGLLGGNNNGTGVQSMKK